MTDAITTRVSHAGYDDHRYFGHSTLNELLGSETFMGLNSMAVTGQRIDPVSRAMLDDLAVIMTVADPRIWPLKLARVIASYGGTIAAFAGAQLCLEGDLLGPWSTLYAAQIWEELRLATGANGIADTTRLDNEITALLTRRKRLAGFGAPFRPRDERLDALRLRVERLGWQDRPFWRLLDALSKRVQDERGIGPNIAAGASALLLDMGFSVAQVPAIMTVLMQNNFAANAIEGAQQKPAVLRSLPTSSVEYVGVPERWTPRGR